MELIYQLDYFMEPTVILSPPKSSNVYALVMQIGAASKKSIPPDLGRAIHAQVMDWLSLGDTQIANLVHQNQNSPLSLSGLIGERRRVITQPGDNFILRISLLDGDLITPLLRGIENWGNKPLILEKCPFVIRSIYSLPGTHPLVDASDYATLTNIRAISGEIGLKFLSPTSFKQAQTVQTFPLPELVFGNLLRRWNAFAPEDYQFPHIEWKGVTCAFELKTHAVRLISGTEIGAKGWVKYHFPDTEQTKIANILSNFAFFAGVGRKTAMGMGQTHLLANNSESLLPNSINTL